MTINLKSNPESMEKVWLPIQMVIF